MSPALVSVLMRTNNSSEVLLPCVDSLHSQDYSPLELIVVGNASSDGTREILGTLEQTCWTTYNETNLGFAAAAFPFNSPS